MLTSIRGLTAATLTAGLFLTAAPVFASENPPTVSLADDPVSEENAAHEAVLSTNTSRVNEPVELASASEMGGESGLTFSGNVAFTTEYRFRGVDLSGGDFAVQGGFDVAHSSGFYVGTWASNLDEDTVGYGSTELDIYGGWSGDLGGVLSADVGVIGYLYPDAGPGDFDYIEFYGSLSAEVGPASVTGGVAYAPDQDSLGGTDNLYLYSDVSVGLPSTPITLNAHVGYTDGFLTFTNDGEAIDWSVSADVAAGPVTLSAAYIGVEGDALIDPGKVFTDDAIVLTVSASF
ncbi:TorF family putative porin [uncultured Erythrobacter sp.]|uniref:TorF family putative porin n=1 Tax=uncultured Erythrobacter sp. TaxID=263913 RepID=UPI002616FAF7|nr:TorF family putative porin [uncultured Erythrobacter sp.]